MHNGKKIEKNLKTLEQIILLLMQTRWSA